uniref:DUF4140 domain-containing protein n=1 Tax=Steinernema glaseri TaxID=37863 RepID=A0A1I7Y8Y3_9BILA
MVRPRAPVYDLYYDCGDYLACKRCGTKLKKQKDKSTSSLNSHRDMCERRSKANSEPLVKQPRLQDEPQEQQTPNDVIARLFATCGMPMPAGESSESSSAMLEGGQHQFPSFFDMTTQPLTFQAKDLPFRKVTVYNDRAEVNRELNVHLTVGVHELIIEGISNAVHPNSLRLDGTGNAVIHEVKFKEAQKSPQAFPGFFHSSPSPSSSEDTPEIEHLLAEASELKNRQEEVEDRKIAYQKQVDSLNAMIMRVGDGEKEKPIFCDDQYTSRVNTFFEFYERKMIQLQRNIREAERGSKNLQKAMDKINTHINHLRMEAKKSPQASRKIQVTVEVPEEGDLEFLLSYQVSMARWRPTYDVRLISAKNSEEKTTLKIDFSAQIQQNTGEDWTDAKIFLSTARPCLGGTVPKLETLNASLHSSMTHYPNRFLGAQQPSSSSRVPTGGFFGMMPAPTVSGYSHGPTRAVENEEEVAPRKEPPPEVAHMEMSVNNTGLTTEFEVANLRTIPSDDSEHKMLITHVAFEPSLLHECVPKKSTNVFLTASVVNNSEFPLLEGDASVYLNHSFVAKTHLKAVAPGEKFTCSLGVDNAVKVTYKAPQKYNYETGTVFGKASSVIHTQMITVYNTKPADQITLVVREQIPKSSEERIRVKILEPVVISDSIEEARPGCMLNSDNNLEWTVYVNPTEKKDLTVKWQGEYPLNQHIYYSSDQAVIVPLLR